MSQVGAPGGRHDRRNIHLCECGERGCGSYRPPGSSESVRDLSAQRWVVADHKGWGDSIVYMGPYGDLLKWTGHTTPQPKIGDIIVAETGSGATEFRITELSLMTDPGDQWFAHTPMMAIKR